MDRPGGSHGGSCSSCQLVGRCGVTELLSMREMAADIVSMSHVSW